MDENVEIHTRVKCSFCHLTAISPLTAYCVFVYPDADTVHYLNLNLWMPVSFYLIALRLGWPRQKHVGLQ